MHLSFYQFGLFVVLGLICDASGIRLTSIEQLKVLPTSEYNDSNRFVHTAEEGTQATVEFYRHSTHKDVCLKVYKSKYETPNPWPEIEILQYLKAKNVKYVPQFIDAYRRKDEDGEFVVVVTKLIDGKALIHWPDRQIVPQIMEKLFRIFKKLHKFGIIHRDPTLRNVLVDANGQPYVVDFGMATFRQKNQAVEQLPRPYTGRGIIEGSPLYFSPEVIYEEKVREIANEKIADLKLKAVRLRVNKLYTRQFQGRPHDVWALGVLMVGLYEQSDVGPFGVRWEDLPPGSSRAERNHIVSQNIVAGFDYIKFRHTPAYMQAFAKLLFNADPSQRPTADEAHAFLVQLLRQL